MLSVSLLRCQQWSFRFCKSSSRLQSVNAGCPKLSRRPTCRLSSRGHSAGIRCKLFQLAVNDVKVLESREATSLECLIIKQLGIMALQGAPEVEVRKLHPQFEHNVADISGRNLGVVAEVESMQAG